jgi:spore cortex formation protein SpoVR/YcgB (stage V sporulation)
MKTLNLLNEILPWIALVVLFIAEKVASYYEYTKKNDPEMAKKLQHVGELAKWAVADQSRFEGKAGTDKFTDAVKAVQEQIGDKAITEQTIKGAVQDAYKKEAEKTEPATVEPATSAKPAQPKVEPVLDDLEVHDLSGGENG